MDNELKDFFTDLLKDNNKHLLQVMDKRFDKIDTRLDGMDTRLVSMDTRLDGMDTRLDGMDSRLDGMDTQLNTLDEHIIDMGTRIGDQLDTIERKIGQIPRSYHELETYIGQEFEEQGNIIDTLSAQTIRHQSEIQWIKKKLIENESTTHN